MESSIKEYFKKRKIDRNRAYGKGVRMGILLFRILYSILLFFALFYGNAYLNLIAVAIGAIMLMSDVKLFFARFVIKTTPLKNKVFKAKKESNVTIKTTVKNKFIFTYPICEIFIDIEEGIVISEGFNEKLIFDLPSFTDKTIYYTLHCPHRGQYVVGAETMHVWDDLGMRYLRKKIDSKILLTVYPNIFTINDFNDIKRREEESGFISKESMDYSTSVETRDYNEQDNPRHIHWKISSRLDKLMTKKYFASDNSRLCMYFDTSLPFEFDMKFDFIDKISETCATVCSFLSNERIPFNFIYANEKEIHNSLCDTEADFDGIYYLLASLKFNEANSEVHSSIAEVVNRTDNFGNCVYIFTLNITEKMLYSIKELNYFGFNVVVIYVRKEIEDDTLIWKVKSLCLKFMEIQMDDDIEFSLEAF